MSVFTEEKQLIITADDQTTAAGVIELLKGVTPFGDGLTLILDLRHASLSHLGAQFCKITRYLAIMQERMPIQCALVAADRYQSESLVMLKETLNRLGIPTGLFVSLEEAVSLMRLRHRPIDDTAFAHAC